MSSYAWTEQDLKQMSSNGILPAEVERQLNIFKNPPPFIKLIKPASLNNGISQLNNSQIDLALKKHELAKQQGRFLKFVPASGAASRMFQSLFQFIEPSNLNGQELEAKAKAGDKDSLQFLDLMKKLPQMAFYSELDSVMAAKKLDLSLLLQDGRYEVVLRYLLTEEGLNYAQKPKGLVHFHNYADEKRTSFHEHLVESGAYCEANQMPVRIHFTVSPEHLESFEKQSEAFKSRQNPATRLNIEFSIQSPSTQTIAVDEFNEPFRDENGGIVFRPGGHGALIENLNNLHGDVIYIKNIDNVTIEKALEPTIRWKRILAGHLIDVQENIFSILRLLDMHISDAVLAKTIESLDLGPWLNELVVGQKKELLKNILNRPIRVCGVVRNRGDVGGGPFWVEESNEIDSLQIVESAQIDMNNPVQKKIFEQSTHFNPVDLVCGVRDWKGRPFDLRQFTDPSAVFISRKSVNGKDIKVLELPGLWNGAMANWITILIEVPIETFNPVKTIFDLLKPEHQG